ERQHGLGQGPSLGHSPVGLARPEEGVVAGVAGFVGITLATRRHGEQADEMEYWIQSEALHVGVSPPGYDENPPGA
ncbi:MAG: hypothetical protein ACRBN8_40745, partial [Nannocystales bacterium]